MKRNNLRRTFTAMVSAVSQAEPLGTVVVKISRTNTESDWCVEQFELRSPAGITRANDVVGTFFYRHISDETAWEIDFLERTQTQLEYMLRELRLDEVVFSHITWS